MSRESAIVESAGRKEGQLDTGGLNTESLKTRAATRKGSVLYSSSKA